MNQPPLPTPYLDNPLDTFAPPRRKRSLLSVLAAILLALSLVVAGGGLSLGLVVNPTVANTVVMLTHADYSPSQRRALVAVSQATLRYVTALPFENVSPPEPSPAELTLLNRAAYTPDELSHLRDVRATISWALLAGFSLALLAVLFVTLFRSSRILRAALLAGGLLCLVLPLVIGGGLWLFFDETFELFHRIVYPQGNWQFSQESLLISTFPGQYWLWMGLLWMGLLAFFGLICVVISRFCGQSKLQGVTKAAVRGSINGAKNSPRAGREDASLPHASR
jgi:integral membrane protein (TIGR01906 family)